MSLILRLALILLGAPVMSSGQLDLTKTLTADPAGVTEVQVDAKVADVRLVTGTGATLTAKVVLDSRDTERLTQCARSELKAQRAGSILRFSLSQPGREHCHEKWDVEIPAGRAINATVAVGSIQAALRDHFGDVNVHASVGRAALELNGHRVITTMRRGASESIRLEGRGRGLTLRSKVGNVDAVVSAPPY
jgi:hypothetical protein